MKRRKEKPADPEIDYSLLTEEQKAELSRKPNYKAWGIFFGVVLGLMVVCIVVIAVLANP
ncbi:hypothetical protein MRZ76_06085 [bacterium]|nr:hypothetical protein [bacterium]